MISGSTARYSHLKVGWISLFARTDFVRTCSSFTGGDSCEHAKTRRLGPSDNASENKQRTLQGKRPCSFYTMSDSVAEADPGKDPPAEMNWILGNTNALHLFFGTAGSLFFSQKKVFHIPAHSKFPQDRDVGLKVIKRNGGFELFRHRESNPGVPRKILGKPNTR
jgi:hypothetical protein